VLPVSWPPTEGIAQVFGPSETMDAACVEFDVDLVRLVDGALPRWSMACSQVRRIVAYKADLFAIDWIRVQLIGGDGIAREIDEEMRGYQDPLRELPRRFSGMREGWWREVAFPAFAPNVIELWSRGT